VAFAALAHHLNKHPPDGDALCVTMPGYKPLPSHFAKRLANPSLRLDPDPNCRFEGGRLVVGAEGVWQLKDGRFVADVRILEFADISTSVGAYRYMVTRTTAAFSVESEIACQR
jgi:hypothetical protein